MTDALQLLDALDRPAALARDDGDVRGNALFEALPPAARAAAVGEPTPEGWRATRLDQGARLVIQAAETSGRMLAQERFLATLSHEIRTPLNGVLGMAGLLELTRLDATQKDYLSALRESGEHLLGLVNDVLDFAKLDSDRVELEPAPTDLERLLQGVCELLSPRAYAAGIEIAWAVGADVPPVMADDGRLRQVLFNLAGNAVKMTRDGGVLLTAERRAGSDDDGVRVRFTVRDTGPGLAPEAQARVFEEFVQTEDGARAGGAGLGLAIVRRLARAFGGAVGVESGPGQGAEFWFEATFAPAAGTGPSPQLQGRCIAVVSDSSVVREAACAQIRACGGRAVAFATLAAAEAEATEADALLIDAAPGAKRAPAAPKGRPALVLLPPEARDRIGAYRDAGYAGYLIKPLRRSSLAARVLAALQSAGDAAHTAARLAADDERADPAGACGARVLLAEDNPVNALLARALLVREGCTVERVASGEEALAALAKAPFDLVLMDMRMPGMDGIEAARRLRARGVTTPVVALTANAFEEDRRTCREAGMDDFLTKPLEPAALRAMLSRWTSVAEARKLAS